MPEIVKWEPGKAERAGSWDAAAAREKLKTQATRDDGTVDFAKYRRGFGLVDGDPESEGSYKFPHHSIDEKGNLTTVREGLSAAMDRLGEAPPSVRRRLYNHLKEHYKQFGDDPPEYAFERLRGVPIMRPGEWNGTPVFEGDLQRLADDYDAGIQQAPVSIGHEGFFSDSHGGKDAEGWIESLSMKDGVMVADISDVPKEAAEKVRSGKLKYRSIEVSPPARSSKGWEEVVGLALVNQPAVTGLGENADYLQASSFAGRDTVRMTYQYEEANMPEDKKTTLRRVAEAFGLGKIFFADDPPPPEDPPGDPPAETFSREDREELALLRKEKEEFKRREAERMEADCRQWAEEAVKKFTDENAIAPAVAEAGLEQVLFALKASGLKATFTRAGKSEELELAEAVVACFAANSPKPPEGLDAGGDEGEITSSEVDARAKKFEKVLAEFKKENGRMPTAEEEIGLIADAAGSIYGKGVQK